MTPRDVAKSFKLGRPLEDEIEDAVARYVMAKDKRIAEMEAALRDCVWIAASDCEHEACKGVIERASAVVQMED